MMRVKFNSMTISRTIAAFLAGIVIALKNLFAPFSIFTVASGNSILMRFINMVFPLCHLCSFQLLMSKRVSKLGATRRTIFSNQSPLFIFWHWLATDWTRRLYGKTVWAYLIFLVNIMTAIVTYFTSFPNSMSICFENSGTRNTKRIFSWRSIYGDHGDWFSACFAWFEGCLITRFADAIFTTVILTNHAQVFSHTAIIPQLPGLEVNYEM